MASGYWNKPNLTAETFQNVLEGEEGVWLDTGDLGFVHDGQLYIQGREKEVVVMGTVRSNANHEIGFLADERRMNVALTRAKRRLIVIGDSATLATNEFFSDLLGWFETIGAYRSVWDVAPESDT